MALKSESVNNVRAIIDAIGKNEEQHRETGDNRRLEEGELQGMLRDLAEAVLELNHSK